MSHTDHFPQSVDDPKRLSALDEMAILDTPSEAGFDTIVHLATSLCEAPIALVSLVAENRQWFKARVGFPCSQTSLNSSVCIHVLAEPDILVIPDLSIDPRTRANPLVTSEPFIRFYAGAPLRTTSGYILGSLCVIDHKPRPAGLTNRQATDLRALAAQVTSQLELRRLVKERDALMAERAKAEASALERRQILETITSHIGHALFQIDKGGFVIFANPGAEEMFGWSQAEMLGANLHDLIHHSYPDGRAYPLTDCPLQRAIDDGNLLVNAGDTFFRKDGSSLDALVTNAPVWVDGKIASVVVTINDITLRKRLETMLTAGEAHWRGLFESLQEGLVIGEAIRDRRGRIFDWRYVEVNAAWSKLIGFAVEDAVGKTLSEVLPGVEDEWIDEPAHVVETGEAVTFKRQVGRLNKWFEGRVSPLSGDRFVMLFLDISERVAAEGLVATATRRKAALARLGDHLRATMDADAMGHTLAAIAGPILGAAQAAYASVDAKLEQVTVSASWRAPGVSSIIGCHSLSAYGSYINELNAGEIVAIADVRSDPRTHDQAGAFEMLGIGALINVPVVEHGELVAMFAVLFSDARRISREDEEFARAATDRARAAIARVRAEEAQSVLNQELSHRLKNTLAMVQAITNQTLKGVTDRATVATLEKRLMALATAHDILLRRDWDAADLAECVQRVLDSAGAAGRFEAEGPAIKLGPRAALSTSLLLHELATNASKYGALTRDLGKLVVRWWREGEPGDETLVIEWRETGGPAASEPARKGFGSRLLKMGLVGTGGSSLSYSSSGFEARFRASLRHVQGT